MRLGTGATVLAASAILAFTAHLLGCFAQLTAVFMWYLAGECSILLHVISCSRMVPAANAESSHTEQNDSGFMFAAVQS